MPVELFEEEGLERIPDLRLSQWVFQAGLSRTPDQKRQTLINETLTVIKSESELASFVALLLSS